MCTGPTHCEDEVSEPRVMWDVVEVMQSKPLQPVTRSLALHLHLHLHTHTHTHTLSLSLSFSISHLDMLRRVHVSKQFAFPGYIVSSFS